MILSGLSYLLAISLRELFPEVEIDRIESTDRCFFCDFKFPGEFTASILGSLEERMRAWVHQKAAFQILVMMPSNAAEFLEHQGEKRLARQLRGQSGEVTLLQIDRFFFLLDQETPSLAADLPFFKLVCFWPLKNGIRILGVGADTKEKLKESAQALKTVENLQKKLEKLGLVSWVHNQLIWEARAEDLKDRLRAKLIELYQGFDYTFIPQESELKKILIAWITERQRPGFQFQKKSLSTSGQEPWDIPGLLKDLSWGSLKHVNSFLHLITKFLTIFSFDYEIVSVGKISTPLMKALEAYPLQWISRPGAPSRLEFQVKDSLSRRWTISSLEWDQKNDLLQMSLCCSFERCIALAVDRMNIETILNRLKLIEN